MKTNIPVIAREVKRVYFETDVQMKSVAKVCGEGCSHCCHQNVRVHFGEGPSIEKFIISELSAETKQVVKMNLIKWFEYFDASTPNDRVLNEADILRIEKQITIDRIPCAFLINDKCSIYKGRPLVCRTHSANDSTDLCAQNPHRNGDMKGIEIQKQRMREISRISDMAGIRLLAYAVQETLGLNHRCKPISLDVIATLRPTA